MTGCTFARIRAEAGDTVTVLDSRPHIGGNCYDEDYGGFGLIHVYGPHLFHTNSDAVWNFLSRFTEWRQYEHRVKVRIDVFGKTVPLPINLDSIEALLKKPLADRIIARLMHAFGGVEEFTLEQLRQKSLEDDHELLLARLFNVVYEQVFKPYTIKQWGISPEEIDPAVLRRVPIRLNRDDRYFTDTHQALPVAGYTTMFYRMLDHPSITVGLGQEVGPTDVRDLLNVGHRVFYTGQLDVLFQHRYGPLPYRSLEFKHQPHVPLESATVNTPKGVPETRMTDQSIINAHSNHPGLHVVTFETPGPYQEGRPRFGTPYYPVNNKDSNTVHELYEQEARDLGIDTGGRLGSFRYLNMDQACAQALKKARTIKC